jgi:hypothetical protein
VSVEGGESRGGGEVDWGGGGGGDVCRKGISGGGGAGVGITEESESARGSDAIGLFDREGDGDVVDRRREPAEGRRGCGCWSAG